MKNKQFSKMFTCRCVEEDLVVTQLNEYLEAHPECRVVSLSYFRKETWIDEWLIVVFEKDEEVSA